MLTSSQIYLIFPILGAVLGSALWLNYFKKIDILESERNIDLFIAFLAGFFTPSLSLYISLGMKAAGFHFNGNLTNDFLYSVFGIGLTEELLKLLSALLVFRILKKRMTEPVNYLIYGGVVALGFSIRENFIYYNNYGSQIITGRTFISCLVHIINTSICIYGLYRFQLFHKGKLFSNTIIAVALGVISHGLFDFFLTQPIIGVLTPFLSSVVYLVGINFWVQMMNNAINYSPFFNYNKIATINHLYRNIAWWYVALLSLEFSYAYYYKNVSYALIDLVKNLVNEGLLVSIVTLRISRLSINKRKYYPVLIQMPIHISFHQDEDFKLFGIPLKIRGESPKEFQFIRFMDKEIGITSINAKGNAALTERKARLLKKYFLKNDVVTYLIEMNNEQNNHKEIYLLKPKTNGVTLYHNTYPIAMLFHYNSEQLSNQEIHQLAYRDLKLIDTVLVKEMP